MEKIRIFVRNYWFHLGVLLIFSLSFFFRFYNYENRWGLAYDQAHSALVAKYAVDYAKFPLLGPFSSGGPFQTGGQWYWLLMIGTVLYPFSIITPWIFLSALSTISVLLMIFLGIKIVDKNFGLIVGILMAVSTAQVSQSTNLTNQTPIATFSILSLIFMVIYLRSGKLRYLFLQSLSIGIASTIHIQGVALLPSLLFTAVLGSLGGPALRKGLFLIVLGIFFSWVPVLIADSQNNFYNTFSILSYFSSDQAKVSYEMLGRRWLTFLGIFLPNSWARITGGYGPLGYLIILGAVAIAAIKVLKKTLFKEWLILLLSSFSMVVVLRYTRTPLFDSFLIFLHPFVFLITGWVIYTIFEYKKILGFMVIFSIVLGSAILSLKEIILATNNTAVRVADLRDRLKIKYPTRKFAVYDFRDKTGGTSLPLVLFLNEHGKIDDSGLKIGSVVATSGAEFHHPIVLGNKTGYQLLSLESSTSAELKKEGWILVNPSEIYRKTQLWYLEKNDEN